MTYQEVRDRIQSGDLIGQSHRGWGSWYDIQIQLVRAFTQSEFSHVGCAWVVGGRVFILEAVGSGVRIFPLSQAGDFYLIPFGGRWTTEAEQFALAQIGEPYSKWQAIKAFFGWVKPGDTGRWMCAKYVNETLRRCDHEFGEAFTPSQLVEAALDSGATLIHVHQT